ncbi:MAG TPA: hypothetical protein VF981_10585 [Gemmatimonadaceae bacterium]
MTSLRLSRSGFAIPLVLVVIVLLTVLAAATLTVAGVERRVTGSAALQADAWTMAHDGLEVFLATRSALGFTSVPPAAVESTRIRLADGYADVVLTRLRDAQGLEPALYVVKSRGARTDRSTPPVPIAFRTIAQYARWQDPAMQVLSAWTSLGGIRWRNPGGALSGFDACGSAIAVAGTAVPASPGFSQGSGGPVPTGAPDVLDLGPTASAPDSVRIDWARLRAGGFVSGEIDIPPNPWPAGGQWSDPNFWPVIVVQGSLVLPGDGRGLLVVTGDLTMTGGRWWRGVILVGGRVDEHGGNRVNGAMVSGLDRKLGGPALAPDSARGAPRIEYNSCNVMMALAPFRGLAALQNTTVDNIP